MQLTDDQKLKVGAWVESGAPLAEIQRKLNEEFGMSLTYMDVRFLILDLGLQVKDRVVKEPKRPPAPASETVPDEDLGAAETGEDIPGGGPAAVTVELDRITKPGTVVSGTVVFSDGVSAAWSLDQLGRLALSASRPGYQPSPQDVQAFQMELRRALERRGF
ncbi:MAG: hypothetical protein K8T26_02710 [Lentisphaerae bacterium]|nr:hypothetical protein [Lentisphaerota bacterium]